MNSIPCLAHRPVLVTSTEPRPRTTVFGQVPPLSVRLSHQVAARRFVRRPFATSRLGRDHSWIGALLLTAVLLFAGFTPAAAAEPMDSWTPVAIPDSVIKSPTDLIFVNGNYWATGTTGRVQYSADGANWNVVQTPAQGTLRAIVYAQGRFVAVGDYSTIMSSPTGTSDWTIHVSTATASPRYYDVTYAAGKFVAVGGVGLVQYSTNGTDWTSTSVPNAGMTMTGVTWGNNLYVASGELDGSYCIATSPDAVTWTRRYVAAGWGYKAVQFFNGLFVAGETSELATSPDGITWTKLNNVTFQYSNMTIQDLKVINGRLFAFGSAGLVMSTANGTEWTTHTTSTTMDIVALDYNGDRVLIFRIGIISANNGPAKSAPWTPVAVEPVDPVDPNAAAQIANISTRAWVGTGDSKLITGFVVNGTTAKQLLIRGVGPTLGGYGVAGTIVDPKVTLYNSANQEIASNNDWGTFADQAALATESGEVFAFPLTAGSKDAAMLVTLQPGSYTLHLAGNDGGTGVALAEVYDCATGGTCKLVNISSRGFIGTGDSVAIPGFVVAGTKPKKLLVRGVGPTLGGYGVPGTIVDPKITLFNSAQAVVASNDNWSTFANQAELATATAQVFAFPLGAGSTDAAMLVTVNPGTYTAVVSGTNNGTGLALVEVYEVD